MLKLRWLSKRVSLWLQDKYLARWGCFDVCFEDDLPDEAVPGKLYLIGEGGRHWIAAMRCPCGCGETLEMNLLPDSKPVWKLKVENMVPTLHPSVWRKDGCRAHYLLRNGRVIWCK
jgi:Family of unknown function (DUF6527)